MIRHASKAVAAPLRRRAEGGSRSPNAEDDDDENSGGIAIAPPPPAPPDTPDLSDQLRYAVEVFEDCVLVHEGWHERACYGLGEAPVEWTE